jgi:hypothetical protein
MTSRYDGSGANSGTPAFVDGNPWLVNAGGNPSLVDAGAKSWLVDGGGVGGIAGGISSFVDAEGIAWLVDASGIPSFVDASLLHPTRLAANTSATKCHKVPRCLLALNHTQYPIL